MVLMAKRGGWMLRRPTLIGNTKWGKVAYPTGNRVTSWLRNVKAPRVSTKGPLSLMELFFFVPAAIRKNLTTSATKNIF